MAYQHLREFYSVSEVPSVDSVESRTLKIVLHPPIVTTEPLRQHGTNNPTRFLQIYYVTSSSNISEQTSTIKVHFVIFTLVGFTLYSLGYPRGSLKSLYQGRKLSLAPR